MATRRFVYMESPSRARLLRDGIRTRLGRVRLPRPRQPDPAIHPKLYMVSVLCSLPFVFLYMAFYAIRHPILTMDCGGWGDNRLNDPMWVLPPSAYERAGYWPTRANRGTDSDGSGVS